MKLPASVQEIADVIGTERALFLVENLPCYSEKTGDRAETKRPLLYVPKKIAAGHKLETLLGRETALKLVDGFGGEMLKPASCRRWAKSVRLRRHVRRLLGEGLTTAEVARAMSVTARAVRKIIREPNAGDLIPANDNTGPS